MKNKNLPMANSAVKNTVLRTLTKQKNVGKLLKDFAKLYLNNIPDRDSEFYIAENLAKQVLDIFKVVSNRPQNKAVVEVNNPAYTNHTVIKVVATDQPFIIDTIWLQLQRMNIGVHNSFHPILLVERKAGKLVSLKDFEETPPAKYKKESIIYIEIDRVNEVKEQKEIVKNIKSALAVAVNAVVDFPKITSKLNKLISDLEQNLKNGPQREENISFLRWLLQNNFIFLGYREYDVSYPRTKGAEPVLQANNASGLGILHSKSSTLNGKTALSKIAPNIKQYLASDNFITVTKTLDKSQIHRDAYMDYIGVRIHNPKGKVIAEHRFVGLFTSKAYTTPARQIPIVGDKIRRVIEMTKLKLPVASYNFKALQNILDMYPRDELFHIDIEDLYRISNGILHLQERKQVRVFIRHSLCERIVSVLVFIPTEIMSSKIRLKIQNILMETFSGDSFEYQVTMGKNPLARMLFKIRSSKPTVDNIPEKHVEAQVIASTMGWADNLRYLLIDLYAENGLKYYRYYMPAFSLSYQENTSVALAAADIKILNNISNSNPVNFSFYYDTKTSKCPLLRIFKIGEPLELSDVMPMLENMGMRVISERPFKLKNINGETVWLHNFETTAKVGNSVCVNNQELLKALELTWKGELENDPLNGLLAVGDISISQLTLLRLLSAYLQQIDRRFAKPIVISTLLKHHQIAVLLAKLFDARFNIKLNREESIKQQSVVATNIIRALKNVSVLDEDRILRKLKNIILATVRTNAWQNSNSTQALAIKIDSSQIPDLVKPVPYREIFMYSPEVEGVHLRMGAIARGGLRWSDRPTDFRTEVLGLMKAQNTKNTVIVPVGSKGGFIPKKLPTGDRETVMKAVKNVYRMYIRSLLSVTDNRITVNGKTKVIHPRDVVRYDDADPYLVVAADKGTATFSDIANEQAENANFWNFPKGVKAKGFWLGDAFASGGSHGYDHKAMGITARGAWESVKHHFMKLDKDIQKEDFTVVGIGDMSGDVFGNGMLLSKHIKLLGAFNHLHILVDPNPDSAKSWKERKRLFDKPHSNWLDYNKKLLSKGGQIFDRSAKSLKLTPEIKKCFGISASTITPNDLIKHMLKAEVDLLWNGGIGTYIKASTESDLDAADRANDELRINGAEVRALVVGEGGNLGCTQLGRIEYALNGGLINTDALDNSAGVNTSDHEVNIKILLGMAVDSKKLPAPKRNSLLASMTNEVGALVLTDNRLQAQAITLEQQQGIESTDTLYRLQEALVNSGKLDAVLEFLPTVETLENRLANGKGYTRPELYVLMAYAKMDIYNDILASNLGADPALNELLINYFPPELHKFKGIMPQHALAENMVATVLVNKLISRMGITFLNRMRTETGFDTATVVKAFFISSTLFEADRWWELVESQNGKMPASIQAKIYDEIKRLVEFGAFWFLRNAVQPISIEKALKKFTKPFQQVFNRLDKDLENSAEKLTCKECIKALTIKGLKPDMAKTFSIISHLVMVPDIAKTQIDLKTDLSTVMPLYIAIGDRLNLTKLRDLTKQIPITDNWQRVAGLSIIDDLYAHQRRITRHIMQRNKTTNTKDMFTKWASKNSAYLQQYDELLAELFEQPKITYAMLNVVLGQLKGLSV